MKKIDLPAIATARLHAGFQTLKSAFADSGILNLKCQTMGDDHCREMAMLVRDKIGFALGDFTAALADAGWMVRQVSPEVSVILPIGARLHGSLEFGGAVGEGALPELPDFIRDENPQIKTPSKSKPVPSRNSKKIGCRKPAHVENSKKVERRKSEPTGNSKKIGRRK